MCVLFVDDESIITMVVEDALRDTGRDVMTAGHVSAAVELLRQHPGRFSALVSDYHMPGTLNGVDLIEHTRKAYPTIPVIIATGRPDVIRAEWLVQYHVRLLPKPYSTNGLIALLGCELGTNS